MEKRGENERANRLRVTLVTAKNTNCCWMRAYACARESCKKEKTMSNEGYEG